PRDLHEVVFPELADAVELLADQTYFAGLGLLRGIQAADFVLQLGDALPQLRFLPEPGAAAKLEQLALVGNRNGDRCFFGVSEQHPRKRHAFRAVAFGLETRLARRQLVQAFGDDGEVGAGDRIVKLHEDIAGFYAIAVLNVELANDAAGRMLDLLHVRIDDDRALRDERTGDLGRCRPAADASGEQEHNQAAGQEV